MINHMQTHPWNLAMGPAEAVRMAYEAAWPCQNIAR